MKKCNECVYYTNKDFTKEEMRRSNILYVEVVKRMRNICKYCGEDTTYRARKNTKTIKRGK